METPYEKHEQLNHRTIKHSSNGVLIIEECLECGKRFIHNLVEKPVGMRDAFYNPK